MSSAQPAESNTKTNTPIGEGLPPQLHAGKVGYGPNYRAGPTLEEKVAGLKEELMGKVTHNHERVQHGHDIRTGEEKRKKMTGEDEPNPFAAAEEDNSLQSPALGLKDNKFNDEKNPESAVAKTPASSSEHSTTSSTPGYNSTSAATHGQNTNAQTTSASTSGTTASNINQSVSTFGMNKHTTSTVNNASDVNQSAHVPTSTTKANIPSDTQDITKSSNATKTATTGNSGSGHLGSNDHPSFTGSDGHGHVSSDSDSLSRSSYKPSPEKATLDLGDKKEKERAATVAPKGTEAAEHQRKGGNVTDNKYIN